jgi:hypothetical protein
MKSLLQRVLEIHGSPWHVDCLLRVGMSEDCLGSVAVEAAKWGVHFNNSYFCVFEHFLLLASLLSEQCS